MNDPMTKDDARRLTELFNFQKKEKTLEDLVESLKQNIISSKKPLGVIIDFINTNYDNLSDDAKQKLDILIDALLEDKIIRKNVNGRVKENTNYSIPLRLVIVTLLNILPNLIRYGLTLLKLTIGVVEIPAAFIRYINVNEGTKFKWTAYFNKFFISPIKELEKGIFDEVARPAINQFMMKEEFNTNLRNEIETYMKGNNNIRQSGKSLGSYNTANALPNAVRINAVDRPPNSVRTNAVDGPPIADGPPNPVRANAVDGPPHRDKLPNAASQGVLSGIIKNEPLSRLPRRLAPLPRTTVSFPDPKGGKGTSQKTTYKGKQRTVYIGKRGGRYVKDNGKKIYIKNE